MNDQSAVREIMDRVEYWEYENGFLAWSLHTPPIEAHGEWSVVSICRNTKKVVFERSLTDSEIVAVNNAPYDYWGLKLQGEPWAIVQRKRSNFSSDHTPVVGRNKDPMRSVGV